MANRVEYTVGINYKVNEASIKSAQKQLQALMDINANQKVDNDIFGMKAGIDDINDAIQAAGQLQNILNKNINPDLGRVNIQGLNKDLNELGSKGLNEVYNKLAKTGAEGKNAFNTWAAGALTVSTNLHKAKGVLDDFSETLYKSAKWSIASSIFKRFTSEISGAYSYVKNLDTSLNNIRVVTGKSADEMTRFAEKANKAAAALGQSTRAYTDAALIYYQQGLGDNEAQARAEITLKTANITKQSADTVSEELTAVWNGYKVSIEESELYIDRLAAVASNSASSLGELATGMSKVASAAAAMGVTEEQLAAQISTIISVTRQAPESVGTALKTIYARMSDIETGMDEEGTTLGVYTEQMAAMGISVLDSAGSLRDLGGVIEEIGGKWSDFSREQQVALAQTVAGTRQYNNVIALFDNWGQYTDMLDVAANAEGTLAEQNDIYMESVEAHLQTMETKWEGFKDSLLDTDTINALVDAFGAIGEAAETITDALGGGLQALSSIAALLTPLINKHLASEINVGITNWKTNRAYKQSINEQEQTAQTFMSMGVDAQTAHKLAENKSLLLKYDQQLTEEEKKQANLLINQVAQSANEVNTWKEKVDQANRYISALDPLKEKININDITEELKNDAGVAAGNLKLISDAVDEQNKALQEQENIVRQIVDLQEQRNQYDQVGANVSQLKANQAEAERRKEAAKEAAATEQASAEAEAAKAKANAEAERAKAEVEKANAEAAKALRVEEEASKQNIGQEFNNKINEATTSVNEKQEYWSAQIQEQQKKNDENELQRKQELEAKKTEIQLNEAKRRTALEQVQKEADAKKAAADDIRSEIAIAQSIKNEADAAVKRKQAKYSDPKAAEAEKRNAAKAAADLKEIQSRASIANEEQRQANDALKNIKNINAAEKAKDEEALKNIEARHTAEKAKDEEALKQTKQKANIEIQGQKDYLANLEKEREQAIKTADENIKEAQRLAATQEKAVQKADAAKEKSAQKAEAAQEKVEQKTAAAQEVEKQKAEAVKKIEEQITAEKNKQIQLAVEGNKKIDAAVTAMSNFSDQYDGKNQNANFTAFQTKLNNFQESKKEFEAAGGNLFTDSTDEAKALRATLDELQSEYVELKAKVVLANEEIKETGGKALKGFGAQVENESKQSQEALQAIIDKAEQLSTVQLLTNAATSVFRLSTALLQLRDLFSDIKNLSPEEVFTKLGYIAMAGFPAVVSLGKAFQGLGIKMAAAGAKGAAAGTAVNLAWLPTTTAIVGVIAVIGLLVGAYVLLNHKSETALDKAKKNAEATKRAYEELKNSINDLNSSMDTLAEQTDALKDLEKGSLKWNEAVLKVNESVLELIKNYPALVAAMTNNDGVLGIDTNSSAYKNFIEQQQKDLSQAFVNQLQARNAEITAAETQKNQKYTYNVTSHKDHVTDNPTIEKVSHDFSTEELAKFWDAIVAKSGNGQTTEEILAEVLKTDSSINATEVSGLAKELAKNTKALEQAKNKLIHNTQVIEANNQQIGQQIAQEQLGDDWTGLNAAQKEAVAAAQGALYQDQYKSFKDLYKDKEVSDLGDILKQQGGTFSETTITQSDGSTKEGYIVNGSTYTKDELDKNLMLSLTAGFAAQEAVKTYTEDAVEAAKSFRNGKEGLMSFAGNRRGSFNNVAIGKSIVTEEDYDKLYDLESADYNIIAEEYNKAWDKLYATVNKAPDIIGSSLNAIRNDGVATFGTFDEINNILEKVFIKNGSQGVSVVSNMFNLFGDKINEATALMQDVNWSDALSIEKFKDELLKLGIIIKDPDAWDAFINNMRRANTEITTLKRSLDALRNNLKDIQDILPNLQFGDIISDEQYQKILALDEAFAKASFRKTAQGYQATKSNEDYKNESTSLQQSEIYENADKYLQLGQLLPSSLSAYNSSYDIASHGQTVSTGKEGNWTMANAVLSMFNNAKEDPQTQAFLSEMFGEADSIKAAMQGQGSEDFREEVFSQIRQIFEEYFSGKYTEENLNAESNNYLAGTANSVDELERLFQNRDVSEQEYTTSLKLAAKTELEDYEYVEEVLDSNVKRLKELGVQSESTAYAIATSNVKLNQGLQELSKSWEENAKSLDATKKGSIGYSTAMAETKKALESMYDTKISEETIEENLNLITRIAQGDVEAITEFGKRAMQEVINNTEDLKDRFNEDGLGLVALINGIDFSGLTIGEEIANDALIDFLKTLLKEKPELQEQIDEILDGLRIELDVELNEEGIVDQVHLNYKGGVEAIDTSFFEEKESKKMDYIKDEADLYHDINLILKRIENSFKDVERAKKKAYGAGYIALLEQEQQLLLNENAGLTRKKEIADQEASDIQSKLKTKFGVDVNPYSYDYYGQLQAQYNKANAAINAYNNNPTEANKEAADKAKEDYEEFKKLMDRYDTLIVDEIPELEDKIEENLDKVYEANIEKFDLTIQMRIDTTKALKDWNAFKIQYIDNADMDLGSTMAQIAAGNLNAMVNSGQLTTDSSALQTAMAAVATIQAGGTDATFGTDLNAAMERVASSKEQLMSDIKEIRAEVDAAQQAFITSIQQGKEKIDEQAQAYQNVGKAIDNAAKLVQLLYGDDEYGAQASFYDQKYKQDLNQVDLYKQAADDWYKKLQEAEEGSEEYKEYYKNYVDATDKLYTSTINSLEDLQNKHKANVNSAFSELEKQFKNSEEQYNLMKKRSDLYYNSVNSTYQMASLERKINDAMNNTSSLSAQKKLNDLKSQTLDIMKGQDELSKYEVERANKLLDITLKQIDLEEARANKSTVRLQRDSQGNYSYQYVADMDAINDAQAALADSYNDLYNFDLNHYEEIQKQIFDISNEYMQKVKAVYLDTTLTEEEREAELLRLKQEYTPLMEALNTELNTTRKNTTLSAQASIAASYGEEDEAFKSAVQGMNNTYQDDVKGKIFNDFTESIDGLSQMFNGDEDNSFKNQFKKACVACEDSLDDYNEKVGEVEHTSGMNFGSMKDGIDAVADSLDALVTKSNEDVIDALDKEIEKTRTYRDACNEVYKALQDWYNQSCILIGDATKLQEYMQDQAGDAGNLSQAWKGVAEQIDAASRALDEYKEKKDAGFDEDDDTPKQYKATLTWNGLDYSRTSATPLYGAGPGSEVTADSWSFNNGKTRLERVFDNAQDAQNWVSKWVKDAKAQGGIVPFATGGYTGDWNSNDGKLAMLHEKELVLNQDDTKNILAAVEAMRAMQQYSSDLESGISSYNAAMLANLSGEPSISPNMNTSSNSTIEQQITINADFPGVTSQSEIELAFKNLVNSATQRAALYRD